MRQVVWRVWLGGWLLVCFAASAETQPSSLLTIGPVPGGLNLRWSSLGSDWAYTLESANALSSQEWQPAPTAVWPIRGSNWIDPRGLSRGTQFYRVTAGKAAAHRGELLASLPLSGFDTNQLSLFFRGIGVPLPTAYGVWAAKLTYETENSFGLRTKATGLIVGPQGPAKRSPLVSYQHGTILVKEDVPSNLQGLETLVGLAMAASGYVAVLPDYVGLGDSPGLHPFVHAKSAAVATIDMLRAARSYCASNSIVLNDQLFLVGYSEGGYATMATHREIETFHADEFTVTACAPMAGPYSLSEWMLDDLLSGRSVPNPYYYLYVLAAYASLYDVGGTLAQLLAPPYNVSLPPLLDGRHGSSVINAAIGTDQPIKILAPDILDALRRDTHHPLRLALRENDVYDWVPQAPVTLYHCGGDRDVIYGNSQLAYDTWRARGATQVKLSNPNPTAGHGECALLALLEAKAWFDQMVRE